MFSNVKTKIRALINDISKSSSETFTYTTSDIFTMSEPNVLTATDFTVNGNALDSGETYALDTSTNKVTLTGASLTADDEVAISFSYYAKYSDTEITEYIRAALVYISIYSECQDYELETDGDGDYNFEPTPSNKQLDMIALVAAILINPNWLKYELPNVKITYAKPQSKEAKIRKLIIRMNSHDGYTELIKMEA